MCVCVCACEVMLPVNGADKIMDSKDVHALFPKTHDPALFLFKMCCRCVKGIETILDYPNEHSLITLVLTSGAVSPLTSVCSEC